MSFNGRNNRLQTFAPENVFSDEYLATIRSSSDALSKGSLRSASTNSYSNLLTKRRLLDDRDIAAHIPVHSVTRGLSTSILNPPSSALRRLEDAILLKEKQRYFSDDLRLSMADQALSSAYLRREESLEQSRQLALLLERRRRMEQEQQELEVLQSTANRLRQEAQVYSSIPTQFAHHPTLGVRLESDRKHMMRPLGDIADQFDRGITAFSMDNTLPTSKKASTLYTNEPYGLSQFRTNDDIRTSLNGQIQRTPRELLQASALHSEKDHILADQRYASPAHSSAPSLSSLQAMVLRRDALLKSLEDDSYFCTQPTSLQDASEIPRAHAKRVLPVQEHSRQTMNPSIIETEIGKKRKVDKAHSTTKTGSPAKRTKQNCPKITQHEHYCKIAEAQSLGRRVDNLRVLNLSSAEDEVNLSPYQCLLRKQIELFEADVDEAETNAQGRNRPILLGQVGIRCRFCAHIDPQERTTGAVYYPNRLKSLYQTAQKMTKMHFMKHCRNIPINIWNELIELEDSVKSSDGKGKAFWGMNIHALGVIESEDEGLLFADRREKCLNLLPAL